MNGRLTIVTNPFGHSLTFGYNANNHVSTVTDPTGQMINYTYDNYNNLIKVAYPDGTAKLYHYNESGLISAGNLPNHLTGISYVDSADSTVRYSKYEYYNNTNITTDPNNRKAIRTEHAQTDNGVPQEKFTLAYNSDTQTTVTDPVNMQEIMTFQTNLGVKNLVSKVNQSDGKSVQQTFDANNNLTCRKDEEGRVTTYTYNATNQRTSMTEGQIGNCASPGTTSATRTTTYQYLSPTLDLPTAIQSPSVATGQNKTTAIQYTDAAHPNLPTNITQNGFTPGGTALSRSVTLAYNALGQVNSINGPRTDVNDVTTLEYNECTTGGGCGQLKRITNALGHVTTYDSYDANGRLAQMTDPNGLVTSYSYDPRGRVRFITQTPPAGAARVTEYRYTAFGEVSLAILSDGMALAYTYDAAQDLKSITDNLGNRIEYHYDLKGNRRAEYTYDPSGTLVRQIDLAYDLRNRLATINAAGSVTQQVRDAVGNLVQEIDPKNNPATQHTPDALNRLIQTLDRLGGTTAYGYDVNDRVKQVTVPNNAATSYVYDDLGNLLQETSPDRGTTNYTYDAAGNVRTITDARGIQSIYSYDALNRAIFIDYPGTPEDVTFTYDTGTGCSAGIGRLCFVQDESGITNYAYDAFGNVVQTNQTLLGVSYLTQYSYDARDRLASLTYPDGIIATYGRDPIGRINQIAATVNGQTTVLASAITYRADGLVTGRTFGNGLAESRLYDAQGRLSNQFVGAADTRVYDYDANSNLTSLQSLPQVATYGYDPLDRLTQDSFINGAFGYDANGNRVQATQAAGTSYVYAPNSNRLQQQTGTDARSYVYDASGNITSDGTRGYNYNARNYLTGVDGGIAYRYNAQAQRVVKTVGNQATVFLYDLAGHVLIEADAAGSVKRHYVYMNDELLAILTAGSTAVDRVIDNTDAGVQFEGDWPTSTAVAGFEGANYQHHSANGAPPGGIVIDNGGAGFTTTGTWPTSTAIAGFEGANYQHHSANGAPPGGLVVDNASGAAVAGTWPASTSVAGYEGANYQVHAAGSGTAVFRWNLNVASSGDYQVFAKWTAYANRATNATYTVVGANGSTPVTVNQQTNSGQWNLLGTFALDGASRVELTDAANGYVIADAVMAVPVNAAPNTATWTPAIPADGSYQVYAKWTAYPNRASNATYTVVHANGGTPVTVNQQTNGGQWNLLGTFTFTAGAGHRIELTDVANGYVIADAVKLVPAGAGPNRAVWPLNPPGSGSYQVFAKWTAYPNRATDAQYTVYHGAGQSTIPVNQQQNGGQWNLLGTFALDGASFVELTDVANGYVIADAIRIVANAGTPTTVQTLYLHSDHEGTPRLATNATGTVVWRGDGGAFGETAPNQDPDGDGNLTTVNLRYPGQYFDSETGLHYNWNRYYDPKTGRYISSDPIGLARGLNTYTYALNNPLRYFDPDGLAVRFICRYVSGLERLGQKHCFVYVTCPEEGWSAILSLFATTTYGAGVPIQARKSLSTPRSPDKLDDPNSSNNTDDILIKPPRPNCETCAYEKSVLGRFNSFPSGDVPYWLTGPNSNSFAGGLLGRPAPPVSNVPGLEFSGSWPSSWR